MNNIEVTKKNARISLAVFSSVLSVALGVFVWIMLDASSNAMSSVLLGSIALVVSVTIITQIIYALKGQIFEFDGRLAKQEILFAIICFQVVMQFGFGFSIYAVKQTELQNAGYDSAYAYFVTIQQKAAGNTLSDYQKLDFETDRPECIESVLLVGEDHQSNAYIYFQFPIGDGRLHMKKSQQYFIRHLREFAVSLLMSLIISVLLMAEMLLLAIKYIENRNVNTELCPSENLRQIAFLLYFAGFLGASFIPVMARNLIGNNPGADFIAGMPYSVEALTNCIGILLATWFYRRKGWKPPFALGACIFTAGLFLSAISPGIFTFIASRGLVGVGLGLCRMTLQNAATLSGDQTERFSSFLSGIYAGIMCGVAFGAVLADMVGFKIVLLVSSVMALLAAIYPMMFRNQKGEDSTVQGTKINVSTRDMGILAIFFALIVIPTCISDAFCGYILPLYFNNLSLPMAYVGRASLLYNLCFVYISSTLLIKLVKKLVKNALFQNALHMAVISIALLIAAYLGPQAMFVAAILLGSADGFGFSLQNSYIINTQVSKKIGVARMLTFYNLFKRFGAMIAPLVLGLFIMNGFQGLGLMGMIFLACIAICAALIIFLQRKVTVGT